MGKEVNAADYSLALKMNMESFIQDFWEEYRNQSTKHNKASERRMRVLLRKFNERVYRPYRDSSLQENESSLDEIMGEE